MTFTRVAANTHFRLLRLRSGSGKWDLGLSPYVHGIRLRMGLTERPPQVMDFCLGMNPQLATDALLAVIAKLDAAAEELHPDEINDLFPWGKNRPDMALHLDRLLGRQSIPSA